MGFEVGVDSIVNLIYLECKYYYMQEIKPLYTVNLSFFKRYRDRYQNSGSFFSPNRYSTSKMKIYIMEFINKKASKNFQNLIIINLNGL